jgi:hypothetical protein
MGTVRSGGISGTTQKERKLGHQGTDVVENKAQIAQTDKH